jgi:hypothetical protein
MAGDGDQPSAVGQTRERRAEMTDGGFGKAAVDVRRSREGWVHQHHARPDRRIEPVVDLLGVVPGDCGISKEAGKEPGARVGDFVERKPRFRQFGKDRQQAGAGGGFQHEIGGSQCGRYGGGETERDRRRELLELLGFFRTARLRGQPGAKPGQHVEHRRRRTRAGAHRAAKFAQEHDLRGFERLVGLLPHPGAVGVGAAEGGLHYGAQGTAVDRAALAEQLGEKCCGMDQTRNLVRRGLRQEQRERGRGWCGRGDRKHGISGVRVESPARSLALSGFTLFRLPSSSSAAGARRNEKGPPPDQRSYGASGEGMAPSSLQSNR